MCKAGDDLVKQVKVYPLSKAANPPPQRFLDMTDIMYNGLFKFDETFFTNLARLLNEEVMQPRDMTMMGMLLPLGIEKGKEFKPDAETVTILKAAAKEAHEWIMDQATTNVTPWWTDSKWVLPTPPISIKTEFPVDGRRITLMRTPEASGFFSIFAPRPNSAPAASTSAPFSTTTASRSKARTTYRLHVPPNVPAREFWSMTIYSLETGSFFLNAPTFTLGSLTENMKKNADGSVDLYIGPKPPAGQESNWLYTQAGTKWFPWFRLYGPEEAAKNKSWKLPDIEKMN